MRQPRHTQWLESSTVPRLEGQREEVILLASKAWDHMVEDGATAGYTERAGAALWKVQPLAGNQPKAEGRRQNTWIFPFSPPVAPQ